VWRNVIEAARESFYSGDCGVDCGDCITDNLRIRVNNESGLVEFSGDAGATWITTGDTVNVYQTQSPPLIGTEAYIRCAVAANLFIWFMEKWSDLLDQLTFYTDATSASDAIFALFPPAYLIIDQIMDAATEIITATISACALVDTVELRDAARCWLYCNIEPYGEITKETWLSFLAWLATETGAGSANAPAAMMAFMESFEFDAVFAQARRWQHGSGACGDCGCDPFDWEFIWDFAAAESVLGWGATGAFDAPTADDRGMLAMVKLYPDDTPDVSRGGFFGQYEILYPDPTTRIKEFEWAYRDVADSNGNQTVTSATRTMRPPDATI